MVPPFKPSAIGEIAIRCHDLAAMAAFYQDVIGLTHLSGALDDAIMFLKVADGIAGHTTVLALFHHTAGRPELHPRGTEPPETGARSSLHHVAFSLPIAEQEKALTWLQAKGIDHRVQVFDWIGWRGVFLHDPEGNTVELVAYDDSFRASQDAEDTL
ncbi:MAG: VOC family protein [Pseudomonadota bacterium]